MNIKVLTKTEFNNLLKKDPNTLFDEFVHELTYENRFFCNDTLCRVLLTYISDIDFIIGREREIDKDDIFYRSRIYKENETTKKSNQEPKGYSIAESGAPDPKYCINANRCSPTYISYLYMSNSKETSIKEIGATLESTISIAKIKPKKELRILDLSVDRCMVASTKKQKWINKIIERIRDIFATLNNSPEVYIVCEYLSEFFKMNKYDGVCYTSSKSSNENEINYVIFKQENCEISSPELFEITDIKITFVKKQMAKYKKL